MPTRPPNPTPASQPGRCPRCRQTLTVVMARQGAAWQCDCNTRRIPWCVLYAPARRPAERKERAA